jgi:hypothetical protein
MTARTVAQWRKAVPAFDKAHRAVEDLRTNWPASRVPHLVAHIHPDTRIVSIVLHGNRGQRDAADTMLTDRYGYPLGGWQQETVHGVTVWRKVVAR